MLDHIMTVRQLIKYAGYELQFEVAAGHDGLDHVHSKQQSRTVQDLLCADITTTLDTNGFRSWDRVKFHT